MRKQKHTIYTNCPVEVVMDMIAGKWKAMILFNLSQRTLRFNELMRLLPSITQRMLTTQLRELEQDALITRTVFAEVPPRVEYSMTPLGLSLGPILGSLKNWAETHARDRVAIRQSAAERQPLDDADMQ
jgi:DNA-binding HxlR family transcriptional regulator